jgi:hypothetical protein
MNSGKNKNWCFAFSWKLRKSLIETLALIVFLVTGHQHANEPVSGLAYRIESFIAVTFVSLDGITGVAGHGD